MAERGGNPEKRPQTGGSGGLEHVASRGEIKKDPKQEEEAQWSSPAIIPAIRLQC